MIPRFMRRQVLLFAGVKRQLFASWSLPVSSCCPPVVRPSKQRIPTRESRSLASFSLHKKTDRRPCDSRASRLDAGTMCSPTRRHTQTRSQSPKRREKMFNQTLTHVNVH